LHNNRTVTNSQFSNLKFVAEVARLWVVPPRNPNFGKFGYRRRRNLKLRKFISYVQTDWQSGDVLITEAGTKAGRTLAGGLGLNMVESADSWSDLLEEHGQALLLLARQWVASHADAEDVLQEAFLRFWRSRSGVDEPVAYLYACMKHCALDAQRGRQRRRQRELATARPETEPMLVAPIEHDERRQAIEASLRGLPTNQAEVLVMKVWGGLTFPQIAVALEISANTAASRYRYALDKLRQQLAAEVIL
jgi:RNA polymerase sigma-70 factor (ECF subfamily)